MNVTCAYHACSLPIKRKKAVKDKDGRMYCDDSCKSRQELRDRAVEDRGEFAVCWEEEQYSQMEVARQLHAPDSGMVVDCPVAL